MHYLESRHLFTSSQANLNYILYCDSFLHILIISRIPELYLIQLQFSIRSSPPLWAFSDFKSQLFSLNFLKINLVKFHAEYLVVIGTIYQHHSI